MAEQADPSTLIPSTGGVKLEVHLARPKDSMRVDIPGLLLLHGFPSNQIGAGKIGFELRQLADRISEEMEWMALALRFRGCGTSTGDFSLQGWVDDAKAGLNYLRTEGRPDRLWVCGFGTGGSLALAAAVDDSTVTGVATVGAPADFKDWAERPEQLLNHARGVGVITASSFPEDTGSWKAELSDVSGYRAAERMSAKSLLIVHGSEDNVVPHFDARLLADAHGDAELHIIRGGGHQLRHDPRAVAVILGWLDRQRTAAARLM